MSNSDDAKARAQMIQKYDMYRAQRRAEMNSRDYVLSQVSTLFPDSESGQAEAPPFPRLSLPPDIVPPGRMTAGRGISPSVQGYPSDSEWDQYEGIKRREVSPIQQVQRQGTPLPPSAFVAGVSPGSSVYAASIEPDRSGSVRSSGTRSGSDFGREDLSASFANLKLAGRSPGKAAYARSGSVSSMGSGSQGRTSASPSPSIPVKSQKRGRPGASTTRPYSGSTAGAITDTKGKGKGPEQPQLKTKPKRKGHRAGQKANKGGKDRKPTNEE